MNKVQLVILWLAGLAVSGFFCSAGMKLLSHASSTAETLENGYPFTYLAGTAWSYIAPTVIVGALLLYSFKGHGKKR